MESSFSIRSARTAEAEISSRRGWPTVESGAASFLRSLELNPNNSLR